MMQTVLGQSPNSYKKALDKRLRCCVALVLVTLAVHLLLLCLRTEQNHSLLLWLNIGLDILCGFILTYQFTLRILPCRRLYSLYTRPKEQIADRVTDISSTSVRYMDMDCYTVTVGNRRLFLPVDTIRLQKDTLYRFSVAANTILEAAQ